jgi:glycosyltransferase involved in cell wall biosynthesis
VGQESDDLQIAFIQLLIRAGVGNGSVEGKAAGLLRGGRFRVVMFKATIFSVKLLHLTPGTGSFHCGSCLRDNALIKALRARGHEAMMAPLYLPMVTDAEEAGEGQPVRVGGISLYLQQKMPRLAGLLPEGVKRWLDDEKRLRWASQFMGMTSPRDLGEMTVGSLLGEQGVQWPEWSALVDWMEKEARPEVVSLSNSLLIGLAPAIKRRLGVPVMVSLQGEDAFLDTLPEPWKSRAWELMRENARSVSKFIAPSRFYADEMMRRLQVGPESMEVVYNGLNFEGYAGRRVEPEVPTIGYLARMIHGKGLTTLVEAFIRLVESGEVSGVRLRVAGAYTKGDEKYLDGLRAKLQGKGLLDRVTFEPNLTFEEKVKFLHEVTVFSVPATYGEAFGLYVAEAQACGVPVVQPHHGAFPELLQLTQGGVLCEPDDVESLKRGLVEVLTNESLRKRLSETGRARAREHFSAPRMAEMFEKVWI